MTDIILIQETVGPEREFNLTGLISLGHIPRKGELIEFSYYETSCYAWYSARVSDVIHKIDVRRGHRTVTCFVDNLVKYAREPL